MIRGVAWLAALLVAVGAGSAYAQTPAAPDIVVLKDGSQLRGTIAEIKKGASVTIVLITGETRTLEMAAVEYAGAAADRPGAKSSHTPTESSGDRPFITVRGKEAPFSFTSQPEGLTLQLQTGSSTAIVSTGRGVGYAVGKSYTPICTAPCEAALPAGLHTLALSLRGGVPVETDDPVRVDPSSKLQGRYESYSGTRLAGWFVMLGGVIGGTALVMHGLVNKEEECDKYGCDDKRSPNWPEVAIGGAITLGGMITGMVLAFKRDEAYITVTPATAASLGAGGDRAGLPKSRDLTLPTGASLQAVF